MRRYPGFGSSGGTHVGFLFERRCWEGCFYDDTCLAADWNKTTGACYYYNAVNTGTRHKDPSYNRYEYQCYPTGAEILVSLIFFFIIYIISLTFMPITIDAATSATTATTKNNSSSNNKNNHYYYSNPCYYNYYYYCCCCCCYCSCLCCCCS